MSEHERIVIGSETQVHEAHANLTGIRRVIRETHARLSAVLEREGVELVPFHTRDDPPSDRYRHSPYLASDPVLQRPLHAMEDLDAQLYLDLNVRMDFTRLFRQRQEHPVPTIFLVYDLFPLQHPEWFPGHSPAHFRVFLQQMLQMADHIVVTSEAVRTDLAGLGWRTSAEVHVMHLGTIFDQQPPTTAPSTPLSLLYVSTVEDRKGHDVLLESFDILRANGVDVDLSILGGEGWQSAHLARAIRDHPEFGRSIHWDEAADDALLQEHARRSHIGVMPSRDEGFGLFVEESLSLGMKAVATALPVFLERPQDNLFYSDGSASGLAAAILEARAAPQRPLRAGDVRTMDDFSRDLAALVLAALP